MYFPFDLFTILIFTHQVNALEKQHLLNKNDRANAFSGAGQMEWNDLFFFLIETSTMLYWLKAQPLLP